MIRALVSVPFFRRYMSAVLAVALTTSVVVGTGFAAPSGSQSATDTVPIAEGTQGDGSGGGGGDAGPTAATPAPDAATPAEAPAAPQVVGRDRQKSVARQTVKSLKAGKEVAPAAPSIAAGAVTAAATPPPYAGFTPVEWQEWRTTPSPGWVKANLGKDYQEGDWISTRLYIDNRSGSGDLRWPAFVVQFDALNANKNAIAVDGASDFMWWVGDSIPTVEGVPAGAEDKSGLFTLGSPTAPTYTVSMASPNPDLVIPQGKVAAIYFKFHLAITPYWMAKANHRGAGLYPGSSAQGTFVGWNGGSVGTKTISVPVGSDVLPKGEIVGKKFNDLNGNGEWDEGEPYLSGWTLKLSYLDWDFPFTITGVTDANGEYHFTGLPAGRYEMTEVLQPGWENTTDLPLSVTLAKDEVACLAIGNAQKMVHKVFTLNLTSAATIPADASYWVKYSIGGVETDKQLTGGPTDFQFAVDLPWNTVIEWYQVYAKVGSEVIPLGAKKAGEKLCTPTVTNPWDFTPGTICGYKQIDTNHDGKPDEPGAGWTIKLWRMDSTGKPVEVASTVTGSDGSYAFDGLLPGTYYVSEVEDANYNRIVPAGENRLGPFVVENCSSYCEGTTFVNQRKAAALKIEKVAAEECVHVGETIHYTIKVTNIGDLDLTNVHVTDAKLGLDYTFPVLAKGASATVPTNLTTYVAKESDGTNVHNVAQATGTSAFGPVGPVEAHEDVPVIHPVITLVKTVNPTSVTLTEDKPTAPVTYTYVITNTGDTTLFGVTLVDDKLGTILGAGGIKGSAITLAAKESVTVTVADVPIDKPTHNVATTEGKDICGKSVSAKDDADVAVKVVKTFKLTLGADVAKADGYFVRYTIDSVTKDEALVAQGGGVYTVTVTVPYGTTISSWQFFATPGPVALGPVAGPETLTCAKTNPLTYVPGEISGHKFVGDLEKNTPAEGWTIYLYRNGGAEPYMTTTTAADGSYKFSGLLPGTYTVSEKENANYIRVKPAGENQYGPFEVKSGSVFSDNDFINKMKTAALKIEKSASPECVHVGDKIQYTIKVTNIGELDLTDVHVTDAKLGLDYTYPMLAKGASATIPADLTTYVAQQSDGTNIHNVAIATGKSAFGDVGPVEASADVCVIRPAITLVKTVAPTTVTVTEDQPTALVTYTYVITNTGDTTLYGVTLVDDKLGTILGVGGKNGPAIAQLAVGESATIVVAGVPISEPIHNVGEACGYDKLEKKVCAQDPADVAVQLIKTFKLTLAAPVAGADSYMVKYSIGEESFMLPLASAGEGVFSATVTVPYGTVIKTWQYFAVVGETQVALAPVAGPETLTKAKTNPLTFDPGEISGHKFVGNLEVNEPAAGWTIYLYRNGGAEPYMTTLTTADGSYKFSGLLPGSYTVSEKEDPDYTRIKPAGENKYGPFEVVSGSEFADNDFVNELKTEDIKGHKFHDLNANGVWDEGEPGLPGWTIKLQVQEAMPNMKAESLSENGWVDFATTVTGEGGAYTFENVPANKAYRIVEVLQEGWTQSYPADGSYLVPARPEGELPDFDFGNWHDSYVFGFKFEDINENGQWDKEAEIPEQGLSGWTIELRDLQGNLVASTVTGEGGHYSFIVDPGTYTINEVLQDEFTQTYPEGNKHTVVVTSNDEFGPYDFGNVAVKLEVPPTFDKSADKNTAIPGEVITYTLTYTNEGEETIKAPFTIEDNYDQRYVSPVDTNGGVDNGDTITWTDETALEPGESRSITYTMRVDAEMPEGTTLVKNTAVLNWSGGKLTDSWTVTVENPVTPVTGLELGLLALFAALALAGSVVLRIAARRA